MIGPFPSLAEAQRYHLVLALMAAQTARIWADSMARAEPLVRTRIPH